MKKVLFILLLQLFILPLSTNAQTVDEDLEKAVKIFNALNEYIKPFSQPKDITPDVLASVEKRANDGSALLKKVIDNGTAEQIKTARYFNVNFKYLQAFTLGIKQERAATFRALNAIKEEFEGYNDANKFPLRYKFEGKNYAVKYDDFAFSLSQYYMLTSELAGFLKKPDIQSEYAKKVYNFPKVDPWYKYLAINQLIDYHKTKKLYNSELAEYSLNQLKIYLTGLNDKGKEILAQLKTPVPLSITKNLQSVLEAQPNFSNNAAILGEAASLLAGLDNRDDAALVSFFENAVKGDKYLNEALSFAKSRMDSKNIISPMTSLNNEQFKALGISILDKKVAQIAETNCEELKKLADDYTFFGNNTQAQSLNARFIKCSEARKKEVERQEILKKAEEERRQKEYRKANQETHFYAGLNVFPFFSKPKDIGGVVNFGSKNTIIELSYLNITQKKENYFDLDLRDIHDVEEHKWNGYFTHIALKLADKRSSKKIKPYLGPLLGYNQRTFEPFTAQVTDKTTNKTTNKTFNPTTKQYIGMFNLGLLALSGIGADFYCGFGAAYNQFDGGNTEVWNKDNFTINDKMITNRKPNYFSFIMRLGFSVGIGK